MYWILKIYIFERNQKNVQGYIFSGIVIREIGKRRLSFIRIPTICGKETRNERLNKRDYGIKRAVWSVWERCSIRAMIGSAGGGRDYRYGVRAAELAHKAEARDIFFRQMTSKQVLSPEGWRSARV